MFRDYSWLTVLPSDPILSHSLVSLQKRNNSALSRLATWWWCEMLSYLRQFSTKLDDSFVDKQCKSPGTPTYGSFGRMCCYSFSVVVVILHCCCLDLATRRVVSSSLSSSLCCWHGTTNTAWFYTYANSVISPITWPANLPRSFLPSRTGYLTRASVVVPIATTRSNNTSNHVCENQL